MPLTLPDLPYDYAALEPTIDARTMEIHHSKHHQAYVDKANAALEGTEWAERPVEEILRNLDSLPDDRRTAVRNNAGGHANHSLFWEIMAPGGGEPQGELRGAIERAAEPLGDRVLFLGARDDVPDLLASFELFAFPSLFEGLCVAVIEAQAAGVPVVATPVGGIRETVEDGVTGFLVPPTDSTALAERIVCCLEHPDEARRVAAEALRRVGRFARERMVEETLALYDRSR